MNDESYLIDDFNSAYLHDASQEIMDLYVNLNPFKDHTVEEKDNRGHIIRRPLFSHSSLGNKLALNLEGIKSEEFGWFKNTSYIVLLHHHNELAAANLQTIPEKVLDYIREGKCKLIFDNTLEGDQSEDFFPIIYNSLKKLNLPPSKLYFITANLVAEQRHDVFLKNNKIETPINVITFMWNVHDIKRLIGEEVLPEVVDIDEEIRYKKENLKNIKKFLKVNRTSRIQRNLMMLFLNKHNILKDSLVSFPSFPEDSVPEHNYQKYFDHAGLFFNITDSNNIEDLKKQIPFDIDDTDKTNHGPAGYGANQFNADLPFQPVHYKNSFISIVMCAFPEVDHACHLHSSTYNPMYCGQPIVQYGPYQALKEMKRRGFKTFDKWWDESYDDIPKDRERLKKVMEVILELSKKTPEELLSMYISMKDVLKHNIKLLSEYDINKELKYKIYER